VATVDRFAITTIPLSYTFLTSFVVDSPSYLVKSGLRIMKIFLCFLVFLFFHTIFQSFLIKTDHYLENCVYRKKYEQSAPQPPSTTKGLLMASANGHRV